MSWRPCGARTCYEPFIEAHVRQKTFYPSVDPAVVGTRTAHKYSNSLALRKGESTMHVDERFPIRQRATAQVPLHPAQTQSRTPYKLRPLELATGWPVGIESIAMPELAPSESPRQILERLLLQALDRPPCVIAFSGGRDSSALLALAVHVARSQGRPLPIPATRVFPEHAATDETAWQSRVVRHLGVDDWIRVSITDECDLLGPIATPLLRQYGVLWPPASIVFVPVCEIARGGSLITGEGGDEVLGPRRVSPIRHLLGGPRRARAALPHVPGAIGPRRLRAAHWRYRLGSGVQEMTWLRPDARAAFLQGLIEDRLTEPLSWNASTTRLARRRSWVHGSATFALLAQPYDVEVHHPLLDPLFLSGLAVTGPLLGPMSRSGALSELVGDLLPQDVLRRQSKATFNTALLGDVSRAFATEWPGNGVDASIVDPPLLRKVWLQPVPHAGSFALLQAAWLGDHA